MSRGNSYHQRILCTHHSVSQLHVIRFLFNHVKHDDLSLQNPDAWWLLYIKPWIRITPYIIGILGGWFYWKHGQTLIGRVQVMPEVILTVHCKKNQVINKNFHWMSHCRIFYHALKVVFIVAKDHCGCPLLVCYMRR